MASRVLRPSLLHRLSSHYTRLQKTRHLLSASYLCDDHWNKRLDNPLVSSINLGEFFYELDRKYKREGKISAIDVDLYVNRMEDPKAEGVVEELEELLRRLRRSPETINTLESTHYAALRILLNGHHTTAIMELLTQPLTYGLFPDHLTCNLLMSTFIQRKEYTAAARVAAYLMLQEDFGPPLTQALALASCYRYITTEEKQPWEDYTPKVEEPKEEVKLRVPYLRNPYFDDHFDLKEPNHIVGKTLAWVSPLVGGTVGRSCQVLGWALYSKWEKLESTLDQLRTQKEPIALSVVSEVKNLVQAAEDQDIRERLLSTLARMEAESGVVEEDLLSSITQLTEHAVKETELPDIKAQEENYRRWEKEREDEYQRQVFEYEKKRLVADIEHKKKDLVARENVIFFFDNEEKLKLLIPEKKTLPDDPLRKKKNLRDKDDDYIPPEV